MVKLQSKQQFLYGKEITMTHELPTVEQLVQVFKDNGWKPKQGSFGATASSIRRGECCAIPALVAFVDKPLLDRLVKEQCCGQSLYDLVNKLFGEYTSQIWNSFDCPEDFTEKKISENNYNDYDAKIRRLGRDLRLILENNQPTM